MACRLRLIMRVTVHQLAYIISYLMYMTMCFTCMLSLVNAIVYNYMCIIAMQREGNIIVNLPLLLRTQG